MYLHLRSTEKYIKRHHFHLPKDSVPSFFNGNFFVKIKFKDLLRRIPQCIGIVSLHFASFSSSYDEKEKKNEKSNIKLKSNIWQYHCNDMVHHNQQPFAFRSIYFSRNVFSTFLPQMMFSSYTYNICISLVVVCVRVSAQYFFFLFSEMIRCSLLSQLKSLYVLVLFGSNFFFHFLFR